MRRWIPLCHPQDIQGLLLTHVLHEAQFQDGQDIIYYDLDQMDKLPARIQRLLQSPERISEIGFC